MRNDDEGRHLATSVPRGHSTPLRAILRRLLFAIGLVVFVAVVVRLGRDGYVDVTGEPIGFLDALYYASVTVTTTGYGDITAVTSGTRLATLLLITPARIQQHELGAVAVEAEEPGGCSPSDRGYQSGDQRRRGVQTEDTSQRRRLVRVGFDGDMTHASNLAARSPHVDDAVGNACDHQYDTGGARRRPSCYWDVGVDPSTGGRRVVKMESWVRTPSVGTSSSPPRPRWCGPSSPTSNARGNGVLSACGAVGSTALTGRSSAPDTEA